MKKIGYILIIGFIACKPSNQIGEMMGVPKETTLHDTHWMAVELDGQALTADIKRPYLVLSADNRVSGFGGCNTISGSYEHSGKKLTFGNIISTKMFCESAKDLEPAFLKILTETTHYTIHDHQLVFYTQDQVRARFISEALGSDKK